MPTSIATRSSQPTPNLTPAQVQSTIISIDNTWNLYTNNKIGFSIKIPNVSSEFGGVCSGGKLDVATVPVKVFDDAFGAFITYEYFYEYPVNNSCQKTVNDLSIVNQRASQWKTNPTNPLFDPPNWHIITANVSNDTDLENFIKANYGTGCKLGTKTLSDNGTYDVRVEGDGLDLGETKCPINFILAIKYSPEFKKAATWAIGQSIVFAADKDFNNAYDSDIVSSFKFFK